MERISIEKTNKAIKFPSFALDTKDFVEKQETIKETVQVGKKKVALHIPDIGNFDLTSDRATIVNGIYRRHGQSIRVSTPNITQEEVLPEEFSFIVKKDHWVQFITWDGKKIATFSINEDLLIPSGILAEELAPDPDASASVALKEPTPSHGLTVRTDQVLVLR